MSTLDTKNLKAQGNDYVVVCSVAEGVTSGPSISSGVRGKGVTVTRTGTGAYLATFDDEWSSLVVSNCQLSAGTPGALAGHTVIFDEPAVTAGVVTIAFIVYSAADAVHDLVADEYLELMFVVRATGY